MTRSITVALLPCLASVWSVSNALSLGNSQNIIVSPSVAKADFLNLGKDLSEAVEAGAEWLHFSIQDGRMVPKISFGAPMVAACREAFPNNVVFDVKLGCIEPEHRVPDFVKAGADILSVHPESTLQLGAVINMIDKAGVAPGVVLNPGTPISAVRHVLDQCQVAVVMLVNPGYGGPKYLSTAIEKIRALRALKPDLHISVDGGVSEKNAAELIAAGANVLVAGGGVFKAEDKRAAIANLKYASFVNGN
ncbi:Ribulose-phosphate 3-epimerase [Seminavis robusta]|uniref:ribulose-phosphate 3-epimerase n=1 Tax=Seminavis robusta TaxID=568900 RepID=A0A9N8DS34_9STRA|nr:Ribulose-phosphate 3-epimerase [Seminavis robusta]|eukprot:Sro301_g111900.1 Ribulose-phosphate 3-epimerase (249) ;mRNA; r:28371-29212